MGIRVGGLSSGLDTAKLIEAFIAFERRPLDLVEKRKAEVENERTLFLDLNSKLKALQDAAEAIDNLNSTLSGPNLDEELLAFGTTSTDESVLTANATGNAIPGSYVVDVLQVATVGRRFSAGFTPASVVAGGGDTLSIDYGGASPIALTFAGTETLQDVAAAINADVNNVDGVRAEVIFDGTNDRLIVSGLGTGSAGALMVSTTLTDGGGGPFFDAALQQNAQDAQLSVFGGLTVTRSENDITDVIPGVSLNLKAADPGNPVTIDVARDDEAITEKLQDFVDAYNAVMFFVNSQSRFDETTQKAGPLSGNPTLRGLQGTIFSALQGTSANPYAFAGNPLRSVGEFGLDLDDDGLLTLNQTKLTAKLDEDVFDVRQFLSGDGTNLGVAGMISQVLEGYTQSTSGIMDGIDSTLDRRIRSFDTQIERMEERLERREELLVLQFARLETSLAALQGQGNALGGLLINQQPR